MSTRENSAVLLARPVINMRRPDRHRSICQTCHCVNIILAVGYLAIGDFLCVGRLCSTLNPKRQSEQVHGELLLLGVGNA